MTQRGTQTAPDVDFVVVGAGFGGLNAVHNLNAAGYSVRAFDSAPTVGGTWFWNSYPGARVDIETLEYSYGFMDEIQQEWSWPHRYAMGEDVLRYLEWVADRLDLRRHYDFKIRVESCVYDAESATWTTTTDTGEQIVSRFVLLAVGFLSAVNYPDLPGLDSFEGDLVHTGAWNTQIELAGKRVGVLGAASSAVQLAPVIADEVGHLTMLQRTPNWCSPIRNEPLDPHYEEYVKKYYREIRTLEHDSGVSGMILVDKKITMPSPRKAFDISDEEREAIYQRIWDRGGPHWSFAFSDTSTDMAANKALADFTERKIRSIVKDPEIADKLIPDHPIGSRRRPGVTGYYEMFNRDNVSLASLLDDPISTVTPTGVRFESGREIDLDVLICATGFDSGAGAALRIDIRGRDGLTLNEHWSGGVRSHLGMMATGFPNLFLINGAQSPSAFFSPPLLADYQNRYILRMLDGMAETGVAAIEPTPESVADWQVKLDEAIEGTVVAQGDGWWMSANIPGKPRQVQVWGAPFREYRFIAEAALSGFDGYLTEKPASA